MRKNRSSERLVGTGAFGTNVQGMNRVLAKGCGQVELDHSAYGAISLKLLQVVKTLM